MGWEATWWPSAPLPLPFCLFLFLASLAWRCGVCGTPGMRACCVRRSGCRREGLRAVLTAVSAYKNREKCCPDCVGVCAECVQVNPIFHVHVTPSPWTHTHVAPLHKHAHPVIAGAPAPAQRPASTLSELQISPRYAFTPWTASPPRPARALYPSWSRGTASRPVAHTVGKAESAYLAFRGRSRGAG